MTDVLVRQTDRKVDQAAIATLRKRLRGALLQASDPGYVEARTIWNAMIAKRPALIARVSGSADVVACVNFARETGMPLSVRGGGHNVAGAALCDGGLMIAMSLRRGVRVDPGCRIVRVEGGATWGDVDHETQPFGLVVPSGIVSNTGVAGFTMGGGFGWTSRKFGYAADNLVSVDIVTAATDRQRHAVVVREIHAGDDVRTAGHPRDQSGPFRDHCVPDRARLGVSGVGGLQQRAAQPLAKRDDRGLIQLAVGLPDKNVAHGSLRFDAMTKAIACRCIRLSCACTRQPGM